MAIGDSHFFLVFKSPWGGAQAYPVEKEVSV